MKLLKKVSIIEVKRCYVMSQFIRWRNGHKGRLRTISKKEYVKKMEQAKIKVGKLSRKQLDAIIGAEWQGRRLRAYDDSDWYLGEVKVDEVGVWRWNGRLLRMWTKGPLSETADHISHVLSHRGLKHEEALVVSVIKGILNTSMDFIQKEKYLLPIVFEGGTGTRGRKRLRTKTKWDIDDGCMRSIALAISGVKKIKVYYGVPKK